MAGNYYFFLVGKNDNLIYECEFLKQTEKKVKKKLLFKYYFR